MGRRGRVALFAFAALLCASEVGGLLYAHAVHKAARDRGWGRPANGDWVCARSELRTEFKPGQVGRSVAVIRAIRAECVEYRRFGD